MQFAPLPADMIRRCEPAATRQDLVLAKQKWHVMDQIALQWRAKTQDPASSRLSTKAGRAISALFAGPGRTGKTLAVEVLANETRLAFYSIDLSRVVSKYLGETEKKLEALFDATREAGALLFFDEADAHDRYANLGANSLLQRFEDYRGIVILATKDKQNFDPAFLRRLCCVVDFAFPDLAQRADIWRRIFRPDTPVEGLDPERLARLPLSGANIRDIARLSTSLAASEWQPVRMAHLLRAALSECAKIGRPIDVAAIERP